MSGTTAPVRDSSQADLIGPGDSFAPNAPRSKNNVSDPRLDANHRNVEKGARCASQERMPAAQPAWALPGSSTRCGLRELSGLFSGRGSGVAAAAAARRAAAASATGLVELDTRVEQFVRRQQRGHQQQPSLTGLSAAPQSIDAGIHERRHARQASSRRSLFAARPRQPVAASIHAHRYLAHPRRPDY